MRYFSYTLLTFLLFSCVASRAGSAPEPAPAVLLLDGTVLAKTKQRLRSGDAALQPAYKKLLKDADKALTQGPFSVMEKKNDPPSGDRHDYMSLAPYYWPDLSKKDGLPYIRRDGQTNPEVKEYKDKDYMPKLCELVNTLALAYYFSDNEQYAAGAARLLEVWYLDPATRMNPNLNFAQAIKGVNSGRGAGLIDARHFMKVIDAVRLLKGAKAWTPTDDKALKGWFAQFLTWMQTSPIGVDEMDAPNNHGTYYDALRLSMALHLDSTRLVKEIVTSATQRLNSQQDAEGKFPKEMERTIALHYNVFDLHAFFMIAAMAEKTGVDLWKYTGPKGASLKKSFDYFYPFITRQREWTGQQIKPFEYEEGYPLLLAGATKYGCTDCRAQVAKLAGEEAATLRENLLY